MQNRESQRGGKRWAPQTRPPHTGVGTPRSSGRPGLHDPPDLATDGGPGRRQGPQRGEDPKGAKTRATGAPARGSLSRQGLPQGPSPAPAPERTAASHTQGSRLSPSLWRPASSPSFDAARLVSVAVAESSTSPPLHRNCNDFDFAARPRAWGPAPSLLRQGMTPRPRPDLALKSSLFLHLPRVVSRGPWGRRPGSNFPRGEGEGDRLGGHPRLDHGALSSPSSSSGSRRPGVGSPRELPFAHFTPEAVSSWGKGRQGGPDRPRAVSKETEAATREVWFHPPTPPSTVSPPSPSFRPRTHLRDRRPNVPTVFPL